MATDPSYPLCVLNADYWTDAALPIMYSSVGKIKDVRRSKNTRQSPTQIPQSLSPFHDTRGVALGAIDTIFNLTGHRGGNLAPNSYDIFSYLDFDGAPGGYVEFIQWKFPLAVGYLLSTNKYKNISISDLGRTRRLIPMESVNESSYNRTIPDSYVYDEFPNHASLIKESNPEGLDMMFGEPKVRGHNFWVSAFDLIKYGGNVVFRINDMFIDDDVNEALNVGFRYVGIIDSLAGGRYIVAHKGGRGLGFDPIRFADGGEYARRAGGATGIEYAEYTNDINWQRALAIWNLPGRLV